MLALRSERFARIVKESLTIQKYQAVFFVAMPVNTVIRANLTLTDERMSSGTYTELLNYATNFNVPLLIHIVSCMYWRLKSTEL